MTEEQQQEQESRILGVRKYNIIFQVGKTAKMSTAPHLCPGRFFLGIKSDALLRVRVGVNKLKGQVCLQFPAHSAQHQLHLDAVADDDAQ